MGYNFGTMYVPYDNYLRPPPPPLLPPPPPQFHHSRFINGGGPTIVELEPSELGGTVNGSYIGTGRRSYAATDSPKSLGRGRIYNRRLGSRTYLVDETSEITAKSETPKTRPWKEVNDDVSARMMAASSDSPPLIPKKDYDDSPVSNQLRSKQQQHSNSIPSDSGSEGARDTDPVLGGQMTLYRGTPRHPCESFMAPEPIYAYGRMPSRPMNPNMPYMGMVPHPPPPPPPPPMMPFNGPRMVPPPHLPSMLLTDECMPPPPPEAFMHPMHFCPPPMPMDFELFTFDEQKRKKRKNKLKKYRSLECLSFPPPLPPPMFYPHPIGMMPPPPPPPSFVMHPPPPPPDMLMPPMHMGPDGCGGMQFMHHPPQLALPPPPTSTSPPGNMPLMSYHQMTLNRQSTLNGMNQKTPMNDGTLKSINGMTKKNMQNDVEKSKGKSACHRLCCQGFTQILWIIVGIVLIGLILGLVLGLTLV